MSGLNSADILSLVLIGLSTLIGLYRGCIREALTIITWLIAGALSYKFAVQVGAYLVFVTTPEAKKYCGMVAVFIGVLLAGFILKQVICKVYKISTVGGFDRMIGALFGFARGYLIMALVMLFAASNITDQDWYKKSRLVPYYVMSANYIKHSIPSAWNKELQQTKDELNAISPALPEVPATTTPAGNTSGSTSATPTKPATADDLDKALKEADQLLKQQQQQPPPKPNN